jgi:hypothetical protein
MIKLGSVKEELLFIHEKNKYGLLLTQEVVEFAKNPDTHLHSKFEWDDSKAAQAHRIQQARQIITLELKVIKSDKNTQKTQCYVSISDDRKSGGGYRAIETVLADDVLRQQLLEGVLSELLRLKTKYNHLQELAGVFLEIEKFEKVLIPEVT